MTNIEYTALVGGAFCGHHHRSRAAARRCARASGGEATGVIRYPASGVVVSGVEATTGAVRGRPPVDDKRTRRIGMNSDEWKRVVEMARADGYTNTSKWARERLGVGTTK